METAKRVRYLTRFVHFYLALILGGALVGILGYQVTKVRAHIEKVSVTREANGVLNFKTMSDGPFIIVALVASDSPDSAPNIIAQLPRPIVIVESTKITLTEKEVNQLIWYDRLQREKVAAPVTNAPIRAVYYKALLTEATND